MQRGHSQPERLPDFVLVGAMKAATTTVFRWLGDAPGCQLPAVKEPHFFSDDRRYGRGIDWYRSHFAGTGQAVVTGEASASYADPRCADVVAERMQRLLPDVRIVYCVRDPVERLYSHFAHEVLRGRETRAFPEAVADPANPYAAFSRYDDAIRPFRSRFKAGQVLVLPIDEMGRQDHPLWSRAAEHVGLAPMPGPLKRSNETADKIAFGRPLLWLWEHGFVAKADRLPPVVRRAGRALVRRRTFAVRAGATAAREQHIPPELVVELQRQYAAVLQS